MKLDNYNFNFILTKNCISIKELSKISGVSNATIIKIKKRACEPRPITVGKIAKALGVDVTELIETEK